MSEGYLYILKPIGLRGPYKIGHSRMPAHRLLNLAAYSPFPLEIVSQTSAALQTEAQVHACLRAAWSHHEWFHATDAVIAFVEAITEGVSIAEALGFASIAEMPKAKRVRSPLFSERMSYAVLVRHHAPEATAHPGAVGNILRRWMNENVRPSAAEFKVLHSVIPVSRFFLGNIA